MLTRWLINRFPYKARLRLTDAILPRKPSGVVAEAADRFRKARREWGKLSIFGILAVLAAMLGAASWEGAGIAASRALASSAQVMVVALLLACLSVGLDVFEDYARAHLAYRREEPDEWSTPEDDHHFDLAGDWQEQRAGTTVPAALRWYASDWGATLLLGGAAVTLIIGLLDAAQGLVAVAK